MAIRSIVVKTGAYAMLGTLALGTSGLVAASPAGLATVLLTAKLGTTSTAAAKVAALVFGGVALRYGPEHAFKACELLSGALYDKAFSQAAKAKNFVVGRKLINKEIASPQPSVKAGELAAPSLLG